MSRQKNKKKKIVSNIGPNKQKCVPIPKLYH